MVQIKRCQSKKHQYGGCGDPKCPEGLSIQKALEKAVADKNFDAYVTAQGLTAENLSSVNKSDGFAELRFRNHDTKNMAFMRVPLHRPGLQDQYKNVDRTNLPSFDNIDDFNNHVRALYPEGVQYSAMEDRGRSGDSPWKSIHVDIRVDADLRGAGIGRHIRQMLMKYADEHGIVVGGTPTNSGDGTVPQTNDFQEEYKQNALKHRARLVKFYKDSGYEYNFGYFPADRVDYWTKEEYPKNDEWKARFTPEAQAFLADVGFYVRWPNNQIPASMLKRSKKKAAVK